MALCSLNGANHKLIRILLSVLAVKSPLLLIPHLKTTNPFLAYLTFLIFDYIYCKEALNVEL